MTLTDILTWIYTTSMPLTHILTWIYAASAALSVTQTFLLRADTVGVCSASLQAVSDRRPVVPRASVIFVCQGDRLALSLIGY